MGFEPSTNRVKVISLQEQFPAYRTPVINKADNTHAILIAI